MSAAESLGSDSIDDSLGDGQPLGDVVKEHDEFHTSPSFGTDDQSVGGERPGSAEYVEPGHHKGAPL
jgi:hypothetical protein